MAKGKSKIIFGDEKIKNAFDKLDSSKTEDKKLKEWVRKGFF